MKLTYLNDTNWWASNTGTVWLHWCDTRCKSRTDSWGLLTALRVLLDSCLSVYLSGSLGWGPPLPTAYPVLIFSAAGCIFTLKPDSSALWQQQHLPEAHLGSLTSSAQTTNISVSPLLNPFKISYSLSTYVQFVSHIYAYIERYIYCVMLVWQLLLNSWILEKTLLLKQCNFSLHSKYSYPQRSVALISHQSSIFHSRAHHRKIKLIKMQRITEYLCSVTRDTCAI